MKVEACGLCHSDMLTKEGLNSRLGLPQSPRPRVAGTVDELGEGVTNWSKGQRVGVGWIGGHCTICQPCRRGKFAACEKAQIPGIVYDEGYAEHMITSAQGLAAIPDALSFTEAAPLLRETRRPSLYRYQRSPARRSSSKTRWRKTIPATVPDSKSMTPLVAGLCVDGTLMVIGVNPDSIEVSPMQIVMTRRGVRGWPSGTATDSEDAMRLAALSGIRP
jgi:D-arabinose 1-dehydrogenase-like Zn-dependent alcohol dehydrogenase